MFFPLNLLTIQMMMVMVMELLPCMLSWSLFLFYTSEYVWYVFNCILGLEMVGILELGVEKDRW